MMIRLITVIALVSLCSAAAVPKRGRGGRIVGGQEITIEERFFQVLLMDGNSLYCGGIILSKATIMTAAHCAGLNPTRYRLRIGSTQRSSGGIILTVGSVLRHPNYSSSTFNNDIALFYPNEAIEWSAQVGPAVLAAADFVVPDGKDMWVSGWGDLASGSGRFPENLHLVDAKKVNITVCKSAYGQNAITPEMICGGVTGKDSCQGDSGGPLTYYDEDSDEEYLVGVVSWGRGCAAAGYPGVYAHIASALRGWIDQNLRGEK